MLSNLFRSCFTTRAHESFFCFFLIFSIAMIQVVYILVYYFFEKLLKKYFLFYFYPLFHFKISLRDLQLKLSIIFFFHRILLLSAAFIYILSFFSFFLLSYLFVDHILNQIFFFLFSSVFKVNYYRWWYSPSRMYFHSDDILYNRSINLSLSKTESKK
jgi:hypothetical protein